MFTLGGETVLLKSSKQIVIVISIMEYEFITLEKCREEA